MKRALVRLLPGGVLLLAATMLPSLAALRDSLPALLPVYFYVVFGVGILLAWRFDRSRLVLALLVLALADGALLRFAGNRAAESGRVVFDAVALLLPLNLAALSWIAERGLLTPRGLRRAFLLAIQALAVAAISRPALAGSAAWLEHRLVETGVLRAIDLPQPAIVAYALAFLLVGLRFILHPTPLEAGSLWALGGSLLALTAGPGLGSTLYLTTAQLILVISLIEASYGMAYGDELTGLPGRRALNEALLKLGDRYAIAMVDVDHFKRFNDKYGHDVGDQLLRMVGSKLAKAGGGGTAFRYGGEEFAVIFPGMSVEEALPFLESLRRIIEASVFTVRSRLRAPKKPKKRRASGARKKVSVTVSIGVAEANRSQPTPEQVIEAADAALYRAKQAGRNRLLA